MSKTLVIVESPAKCKTIKKYLGPDFEVLASYGHVRDLVPKSGAVDTDNNFSMKYEVVERNQKHLDAIKKALKGCNALMLATDPDREGEAISWHISEYLKEINALKDISVSRVVFNEITQKAVLDAVAHPRTISMDLVNAQQARRALDYLVGFNLSPLLWKKVSPGLSAGRVQSPSLRMICEREDEIRAFVTEEYWTIEADLFKDNAAFKGKLTEYSGEKLKQFSVTNADMADAVKITLLEKFGQEIPVYNIEKKQRNRYPSPPFTTSTLQQEASRKLGFSAQRTMKTAQTLYEGVNLGSESIGLITYMRTDSVSLAVEALTEIRGLINQRYGKEYLPDTPRFYKTKSKNAQEAHEAVRPTSAMRHPDQMKAFLSSDQFRLYELIWKRTIACQMMHAIMDTVAIDLGIKGLHTIRANGSTIAFPGFISVYIEGIDDQKEEEGEGKILPQMQVGDRIKLADIIPNQHFTEPPPRYSEASLVKALEEYGIGRPSTYASIISTLQSREYVVMDARRFIPTDVGHIVSRFLVSHFMRYVDYGFTASLEDDLDAVSRGEKEWIPLLSAFWTPFIALCKDKELSVSRADVAQSRELGIDPKTNKPVSVRIGRFGPFAQIGVKEDEDKPKFAALRPNQRIDTITLDEALNLFQLPRTLGETADGEVVKTSVGRFGPYIQFGKKYVSLKEDDPYTVDLTRALALIDAYKMVQAAKFIKAFEGTDIQVLNGRFGPYITDGEKNAKIPKDADPSLLTLEECQLLLEKAPVKKTKTGTKKKAVAKKTATKKTVIKKTAIPKSRSKKGAEDTDEVPVKKRTSTKKTINKAIVDTENSAAGEIIQSVVTKAVTKKPAVKKVAVKKNAVIKTATKKVIKKVSDSKNDEE